jgi:MFS transporter, FHS family, L-fucose permease
MSDGPLPQQAAANANGQRSVARVLFVMLVFFVISLVTNILDPLAPNIQDSFHLSGMAMGFMAFAFFIAYGVMSIPAGFMIERLGAKPTLLYAFGLALLGAAGFAIWPTYAASLPALFTIGVGFAMLQVVINPLLRVAGGEEHYAFYGNLAQLVFGGASFLSPLIYARLVHGLSVPGPRGALLSGLARVVPADKPWISLYWLFAVVLLAMVGVVALMNLPRLELKEDERIGGLATLRLLLKRPIVWLFFLGIVCYVGLEQGVALKISRFLETTHGVDPAQGGAHAVSGFWGLMMVGCALGLVLLKLFDAKAILVAFGLGAAATLVAALFGSRQTALVALPAMGFWCSVMWPVIFSLALNSVEAHHGSLAGILCTGILGGGLLPPLVGRLGDAFGLRYGLLAILIPIGYIISIGIWAKPIVSNATLLKTEAGGGA